MCGVVDGVGGRGIYNAWGVAVGLRDKLSERSYSSVCIPLCRVIMVFLICPPTHSIKWLVLKISFTNTQSIRLGFLLTSLLPFSQINNEIWIMTTKRQFSFFDATHSTIFRYLLAIEHNDFTGSHEMFCIDFADISLWRCLFKSAKNCYSWKGRT